MSSSAYAINLEPTDQSPYTAYAFQVFREGELVGAVLSKTAPMALALAEVDFGAGETWTIVTVDDEMAELPTQVVLSDGEVTMKFREVAKVVGDAADFLPVWVFREEATDGG